MIAGLLLDVKSAELKKILEERLNYHVEKAKKYNESASALRLSMKTVEDDMEVGKITSGNPAATLENQAKKHGDQSNYYKFMLEHVIQDDVYRLGQDDLRRLGIAVDHY